MGRKNYQGGTFTVEPDGERLKALRGSYPKRPPQHEVEKAAGVSRGQLTRYETGKPASAADLKKLAEFYGVEPAELLSPEGLEMCNQILDEMCLFTNKSVVSNTNGNRVPALKPEDFCSKCGHTGKLRGGACQERVGERLCDCRCDTLDNDTQTPELALSGMTEEESAEIARDYAERAAKEER